MSLKAKISLESLKRYSASVNRVYDFSVSSEKNLFIFDELKEAIIQEINSLSNCIDSLKDAASQVEIKINLYQEEKKEVEEDISDIKENLKNARSELSSIDEYVTMVDSEGYSISTSNPEYDEIESQIEMLESQLSTKKSELIEIVGKIEACNNVKSEISSLSARIDSRLSCLDSYRSTVIKNKNEYEISCRELNLISSDAFSKLSSIEKVIRKYMSVQVKVVPAYDRTKDTDYIRRITDVEYITMRFKQVTNEINKSNSYLDDKGNTYKTSEGLVPNKDFIKNGYAFVTDSKGRVISASGKLKLSNQKKKRDWDASLSEMGKGDEKETDEKGHMIGHRFDGPDSILNAIPQDCSVNKGAYKAFENSLADKLKEGKEIYIDIRPVYDGDSHRPYSLIAVYTVDGIRNIRVFTNEYKDGN